MGGRFIERSIDSYVIVPDFCVFRTHAHIHDAVKATQCPYTHTLSIRGNPRFWIHHISDFSQIRVLDLKMRQKWSLFGMFPGWVRCWMQRGISVPCRLQSKVTLTWRTLWEKSAPPMSMQNRPRNRLRVFRTFINEIFFQKMQNAAHHRYPALIRAG